MDLTVRGEQGTGENCLILFGDQMKKNDMDRIYSTCWERRGAYRVLFAKPEGKRLLGRHKVRWENSIKTRLQTIGWKDMDWIDLAQDRDKWRVL